MKFDLKRPCNQCPFRTDKAPFISHARAKEIADGMVKHGASFACHKTLGHDDDGDTYTKSDSQFCAGAIIMLEKSGQAGNVAMIRGAERFGLYKHSEMEMDSPVFDSPRDFVKHHKKQA